MTEKAYQLKQRILAGEIPTPQEIREALTSDQILDRYYNALIEIKVLKELKESYKARMKSEPAQDQEPEDEIFKTW